MTRGAPSCNMMLLLDGVMHLVQYGGGGSLLESLEIEGWLLKYVKTLHQQRSYSQDTSSVDRIQ